MPVATSAYMAPRPSMAKLSRRPSEGTHGRDQDPPPRIQTARHARKPAAARAHAVQPCQSRDGPSDGPECGPLDAEAVAPGPPLVGAFLTATSRGHQASGA